MTHTKNNIPIYEEQQFIQEEQQIEQIQEVLSKFKQLIPSNFIQIETEHIGSTKQNWGDKPLSERYFFTYEEKEMQIDIPHTILEKLGLGRGKDITQPLYLDPRVLVRPETYKGITVKEGEIFIQKPFTIQNLEKDIDKLFDKIKELEGEKNSDKETIESLKKQLEEIKKIKNIWQNKFLEEKESNKQEIQTKINQLITERNNIRQKLTNQQTEIDNLQNEINRLNDNLKVAQQENDQVQNNLNNLQNQFNQLTTERNQLTNQINNLNQQLTDLTSERNDYQNKWDNSLEDLEQKQEIIRGYLLKIEELEREKEDQENRIGEKNEEINQLTTQKNELQIKNGILQQEKNSLQVERDSRPTQQQLTQIQNQLTSTQQQLQRELSWWDKWINDKVLIQDHKIYFSPANDLEGRYRHLELHIGCDYERKGRGQWGWVDNHDSKKFYLYEEKGRVNYEYVWSSDVPKYRELVKAIYQYYRDR